MWMDEGHEWEGNPQGGKKIPTAEAMLAQRTGYKPPDPLPTTHPVGCCCEQCSAAYEREAWDPRMGVR